MMFAKAVKREGNRETLYYESCLDGFLEACEQLERRGKRLLSAHSKVISTQLKQEDIKGIHDVIQKLEGIRNSFGLRKDNSLAALLGGNRIKAGLVPLPFNGQRNTPSEAKEADTQMAGGDGNLTKTSTSSIEGYQGSQARLSSSLSSAPSSSNSFSLNDRPQLVLTGISQVSQTYTPQERTLTSTQTGPIPYAGYLASLTLNDLSTGKSSLGNSGRYMSQEATQQCITGSGTVFSVPKYADLGVKSRENSNTGSLLPPRRVTVPDGTLTLKVSDYSGSDMNTNDGTSPDKTQEVNFEGEETEVFTQLTEPSTLIVNSAQPSNSNSLLSLRRSVASLRTQEEGDHVRGATSLEEGTRTQSAENMHNSWGERSTSISFNDLSPRNVKEDVTDKDVPSEVRGPLPVSMKEAPVTRKLTLTKEEVTELPGNTKGGKRGQQEITKEKQKNATRKVTASATDNMIELPYVSSGTPQSITDTVKKVVKRLKSEERDFEHVNIPKEVDSQAETARVTENKRGLKLKQQSKRTASNPRQKAAHESAKNQPARPKTKENVKSNYRSTLLLSYTGKRRDDIVKRLMKAVIYYDQDSKYFDYIDDPKDECITHLIAPTDIQRPTLKILYALCQGAYILTPKFLDFAEKAEEWPKEAAYEHPKWPAQSSRPDPSGLMGGIKFHFFGKSRKIGEKDLQNLVCYCGAEVVKDVKGATHCLIPDGYYPPGLATIPENVIIVTENWVISVIDGMKMLPPDVHKDALGELTNSAAKEKGVTPSKIVNRECGKQLGVHAKLESLSTSESLLI